MLLLGYIASKNLQSNYIGGTEGAILVAAAGGKCRSSAPTSKCSVTWFNSIGAIPDIIQRLACLETFYILTSSRTPSVEFSVENVLGRASHMAEGASYRKGADDVAKLSRLT